jgi:putative phosphoesterase
MKILIVSDTHGSLHNFDTVIEREKEIDMLLHLGDVEGDDDYMETVMDCPVHIVGGNNDYFSRLPGEMEIRIGSHKVFLTHGHGYHVSVDTRRLKQAARARGADIVMYGHTHRPEIDLEDDVKVINPGSLSYPRQAGRKATYVIMEIGNTGTAEFYLKYV